MLKNLASLFVEVDNKNKAVAPPKEKEKKSPEATTQQTAQQTAPQPTPQPVQYSIPGSVDPEILKILEDAIEGANLEGYDYLEFRASLAGMANIPLTEAQKYQTAFATVTALKVTKPALIGSIDHYIDVLREKSDEFSAFVSSMKEEELNKRHQAVNVLNQDLQSATDEINRLTQLIQEKRQEQQALGQEIQQKTLEIQTKESAFEATLSSVVSKLNSDKEKIQQYIPDNNVPSK